jgi:FtsP/CotA-like multicopper oxidase with cupredoxin domain
MMWTGSILAFPALGLSVVAPPVLGRAADCGHLPPPVATRAVPNNNRAPVGVLSNGVLTVRLVARPAIWYPDGPDGCGLTVHAFAEEGRAPRIPGPLLRVLAGTTLRVTIRNVLDKPIWIRGLEDRSVERLDSVAIAVGASREFRYRATVPGTYFYWGGDGDAAVPRSNADGELVGALIVDPPSGVADDRIFIMTRWARPAGPDEQLFEVNAINGLSWPNTERLEVMQGTPVRWRIINASNFVHYMHLHGFYFTILSTGNAVREHPRGGRPLVEVTEGVNDGGTFMLQWTPERVGNWIFHCHLATHMSTDQRLDRMPGARLAVDSKRRAGAKRAGSHDSTAHMAGLVLGITVHPAPGTVTREPAKARRQLRLFADVREHVYGDEPGYGFVLEEGGRAPARDSIRIPGTPIVLTRGKPVRITVFNRLPYPLTVHWHGIELERSYVDGVADFSGEPGRTAPAIAAGDSFVVEFTPPRAGTFIYHVHDGPQEHLVSGLYGPLLVVEPGSPPDPPPREHTFVLSEAGPAGLRVKLRADVTGDLTALERFGPTLFINGTATPEPLELRAGTTYRLRFVSIPANAGLRITLDGPDGSQQWRLIAKDGADLPPPQPLRRARFFPGVGETFDFEFTPTASGELWLVLADVVNAALETAGTPTRLPIRVRDRPRPGSPDSGQYYCGRRAPLGLDFQH